MSVHSTHLAALNLDLARHFPHHHLGHPESSGMGLDGAVCMVPHPRGRKTAKGWPGMVNSGLCCPLGAGDETAAPATHGERLLSR
eukprot:13956635-Alexandrium_andersonii.AAC.1